MSPPSSLSHVYARINHVNTSSSGLSLSLALCDSSPSVRQLRRNCVFCPLPPGPCTLCPYHFRCSLAHVQAHTARVNKVSNGFCLSLSRSLYHSLHSLPKGARCAVSHLSTATLSVIPVNCEIFCLIFFRDATCGICSCAYAIFMVLMRLIAQAEVRQLRHMRQVYSFFPHFLGTL